MTFCLNNPNNIMTILHVYHIWEAKAVRKLPGTRWLHGHHWQPVKCSYIDLIECLLTKLQAWYTVYFFHINFLRASGFSANVQTLGRPHCPDMFATGAPLGALRPGRCFASAKLRRGTRPGAKWCERMQERIPAATNEWAHICLASHVRWPCGYFT